MAITDHDVELFAQRIEAWFPQEQRDAAYSLAYPIAQLVGAKSKQLRPDTRLSAILEWLSHADVFGIAEMDEVEVLMAFEEEAKLVIPDSMAAQSDDISFADLVKLRLRAIAK